MIIDHESEEQERETYIHCANSKVNDNHDKVEGIIFLY